MDILSLLSIFFTLAVVFFSSWKWKSFYFGCCYCAKWLAIYVILKWRNLTDEFPGAGIPIFPSKREKYLENPRVWPAEKGWCRDSMLLWCGTPDLWLLAEVERGRHNSAAASVHLRLAQTEYLTSGEECELEVAGGWSTESLSLECLEPMRRWRLACNARLYTRNEEGKKCTKHVRINLVWAALDGPYHFRSDADTFTLACVLAAHPFANRQLNLDSLARGYEQWGAVVGWVHVGGDETHVHAPCLRRRCWGPLSPSPHRTLALIAENSTLATVFSSSAIGRQLGHIRYPDGRIEKVSGSSILEFTESRERFVTTFSGCGGSHLVYTVRRQWRGGGNGWAEARCTLDGLPAIALVLYSARKVRLARLPVVEFPVGVASGGDEWLALPLNHPACACPSLVGGKAASLAVLTDMAQTVLTNKMVVPVGFCLTVDAMRLQTQSSEAICAAVKFLGLVASGQEKGYLEKECQHAVQAWLSAPVCGTVQAALSAHLSANANRRPLTAYAVRSSALTEDCPLASSAGLNASVLGVNTQQVADALRKCWASLYSYKSVQYRRHAGLPVVTWMGVVVQEVVGGESAGVTFTRHPQSGDPHRLVITANYGLGETVVSGQVEPDTIVVNTEQPSHHVVHEVTVGKKQTRLTITGDGSIVSEPVPAELCMVLCLSRPEVIALSRLGLALHRLFGSPCDIEWTIAKGVIYVVQCRPITCLFPWTDDELLRELDSAILPGDATTSANAGEVLPGVTSPLCQSTVLRCADFIMVPQFAGVHHKSWYNNNHITLSHHHAFLHLYNTLLRSVGPEASLAQKVLELAVCGHRVTGDGEGRIQAAAAARHLATPPLTTLQKGASVLHVIKQILFSKSSAKKAQKIGEEFRIECDGFTSASALYDYLTASYVHVLEVLRLHNRLSFTSTVWQTILFTLLAGNQKELKETNFRDISKLLVGEQAVVSAQIPDDIEKLTGVIKQGCGEWGEVKHIAPNRVAAWLELHCPPAAAKLADVIRRYAHRGVKDLDIVTDTWGLDSSPLIAMVQASLGVMEGDRGGGVRTGRGDTSVTEEANQRSIHQLLSSSRPIFRWLANLLVGQCREAVARRELTKDACLRAVHQMRLGHRTLARLMRQEGRLPTDDPRILCLCTHHEIGLLLAPSPDPPLLHKISRRQRNWQEWDSLRFPEVMMDLPAPVQLTTHPSVGSGESVEGMLVCAGGGGGVRARACVLLSLSEAVKLRPGDVLVTRATDVGWTPLFPILAAVVTELGGLISHGAVVAREYGLPCIVGATNATIVFKTGDELYLDGKSGKVQKIA